MSIVEMRRSVVPIKLVCSCVREASKVSSSAAGFSQSRRTITQRRNVSSRSFVRLVGSGGGGSEHWSVVSDLRVRFASTSSIGGNGESSLSAHSDTKKEALPWFAEETESLPWVNQAGTGGVESSDAKLATAPEPLPPPPDHLPEALHPLHAHLTLSPFIERDTITYINAKECDPDEAWCDWVIVCSLRKSRERGIRGAIEGVKVFLMQNPLSFDVYPPSQPMAPEAVKPVITGIPSSPSKHGKSKSGGLSRSEQATGWAMLDHGSVIVHVLTEEARVHWGIETLWERVKKEGQAELVQQVRKDASYLPALIARVELEEQAAQQKLETELQGQNEEELPEVKAEEVDHFDPKVDEWEKVKGEDTGFESQFLDVGSFDDGSYPSEAVEEIDSEKDADTHR